MADYTGWEQFEQYVAEVQETKAREVVMSAVRDFYAKSLADGAAFTAQPIVRILCSVDVPERTPDDDFATRQLTWEVTVEPKTSEQERAELDRIIRALRSRGFSVALATTYT